MTYIQTKKNKCLCGEHWSMNGYNEWWCPRCSEFKREATEEEIKQKEICINKAFLNLAKCINGNRI